MLLDSKSEPLEFKPRANITTCPFKEDFGELATTQCLHNEDYEPVTEDKCRYYGKDMEDTEDGYILKFHQWLQNEKRFEGWYLEPNHFVSFAYDFRHVPSSSKCSDGRGVYEIG